jgi:hypothetical protein
MISSINIQGYNVEFMVNGNAVTFTVNGTFEWVECPCKVAITRWLLKQFELAKAQYTFLVCSAYRGDKKGDVREAIYKKVGFRVTEVGLLWGEIPEYPTSVSSRRSRRASSALIIRNTDLEEGFCPASRLPYEWDNGALVITRLLLNEGFCPAEDLSYDDYGEEYQEDISCFDD